MKCCMCGKTFVLLLLHTCTALATSCHQVYPSEYAYEDGSVAEQESIIANCRRYQKGLQEGVFTAQYTHCNGIQLKLRDSDLGQQQCQTADYYVWLAGSAQQLLFIFPTRVSLTTITLHYYSGCFQGLPRLSFYAVPNDFDVWDLPTTSYPHVVLLQSHQVENEQVAGVSASTSTSIQRKY